MSATWFTRRRAAGTAPAGPATACPPASPSTPAPMACTITIPSPEQSNEDRPPRSVAADAPARAGAKRTGSAVHRRRGHSGGNRQGQGGTEIADHKFHPAGGDLWAV